MRIHEVDVMVVRECLEDGRRTAFGFFVMG
jgi:hypothetical protein